ncbi:hypothetical protein SLS62_006385 [Diatrype stigma]|uniref:F-box domain-containing protein n=1 Tax=Diatrype stigma TaxID=117547 RepID=A0AAN9UYR5_9PEZI
MEQLPTELKAMVAGFVPDPKSLISLALTNKTFRAIVEQDEAKICTSICHRHFGHELLPLAMAVLRSREFLEPRTYYGQPQQRVQDDRDDATLVDDLMNFIDLHFRHEWPLEMQMDIKLCTSLFDFDSVVSTYATSIAGLALENTPGVSTKHIEITRSEATRFRKSLYITELLHNLFPRDHISPAVVSAQRVTALQPAWQHLLTQFAPWELQQVRCAKDLLTRHLMNVIASDAAKHGLKRPQTYNLSLRSFVSNEGLIHLSKLETLGERLGTKSAYVQFNRTAQGHLSSDQWLRIHDTIWLEDVGGNTSLDATAIVDRYPESESGPRDAWLHTLLQNDVEDPMFEECSILYFACNYHAARWGYAFWDRARLNTMAGGTLPTTAQMLAVSDVQVPTDDFIFYTNFRREKDCSCGLYKY